MPAGQKQLRLSALAGMPLGRSTRPLKSVRMVITLVIAARQARPKSLAVSYVSDSITRANQIAQFPNVASNSAFHCGNATDRTVTDTPF